MAKDAVPIISLSTSRLSVMPVDGKADAALVLVVKNAAKLPRELLIAPPIDLQGQFGALTRTAFGKPQELQAGSDGTRSWLLPMTITGIGAPETQTRYLQVQVDKTSWTGGYELNSTEAPQRWQISPKPAEERVVGSDWRVPLNIVARGAPTDIKLRLAPAEFVEATRPHILRDGQLALCSTIEVCAGVETIVKPPGQTLWLAVKQDEHSLPGKYTGSVTLVSNDRPEGETIRLVLYVTSWKWQVLGGLCIAAGVGLAFVITNLLRQRISRLEMLGPVVDLLAMIDALRLRLKSVKIPYKFEKLLKELDRVEAGLEEPVLRRKGLPSVLGNFFGNSTSSADTLAVYVAAQRAILERLLIIVDEGLEPIEEMRVAYLTGIESPPPAAVQAVLDAWKNADTFSALEILAADDLRIALADIVAKLDIALKQALEIPISESLFAFAHRTVRHLPRTRAHLNYLVFSTNLAGWVFLLLLTTLAGVYVLIIDEPAFGTPKDLLECLFWGLGLPAGMQAASTATLSIANVYRPTTT
ncbi:hypothetical protein LK542_22105 [Massilia sp. IC2-477]|uniref:hypothetical protein n=1 Tax=Massilia sp. IC2-477 TaxID=2887198 RepID=UPI001D102B9F|nr:hypothetical protein [Massilia sp. IC2-477]MCC2958312.1 hypothetical protein [Massilia sp. IC2-477]